MKLITAVIQPMRLHAVYAALDGIGITGLTSAEVQRIMPHREHQYTDNCREDAPSVRSKIRIEVIVADEQLAAAVAAITDAAHTGNAGDGNLFVTPLDQAVSLHTRKSYSESPRTHRVKVAVLEPGPQDSALEH